MAVTPDFLELTVSAEHVPRDLVIRIARGPVVGGRVLDPQGRPEQNARVIAAAADPPWEKSRRESVTLRITPNTPLVGPVIRQGDPAEGVKVSLQRAEPIDRGGFRDRVRNEAVTDDQGRYRLRGLSEGDRLKELFRNNRGPSKPPHPDLSPQGRGDCGSYF